MLNLGTVLGVWAHPDDETYLTAGLMEQSIRDGSRVAVLLNADARVGRGVRGRHEQVQRVRPGDSAGDAHRGACAQLPTPTRRPGIEASVDPSACLAGGRNDERVRRGLLPQEYEG